MTERPGRADLHIHTTASNGVDDVVAVVEAYAAWHSKSLVPKLFVNAEPGSILTGRQREFCRRWQNQQEVTVRGSHFIQEDSPVEIGRAALGRVRRMVPCQRCSVTLFDFVQGQAQRRPEHANGEAARQSAERPVPAFRRSGHRSTRSSTWATRWCGWRTRSIGASSIAASSRSIAVTEAPLARRAAL